MGLFSGQSKTEVKVEPQVLPSPEEQFDELPSLPKPRASTLITKGITFSGKLYGEGSIQIEGVVDGEIDLLGSVTIAGTGLVKGPITADVIRIAGHVEGDVTARDHLRLEKSGQMDGDVATVSLVVEDGGRLNGRSTMLQRERAASPLESGGGDLEFGPGFKVGDGEGELI